MSTASSAAINLLRVSAFSFSLLFFSCEKQQHGQCDFEGNYEFQLPVVIEPSLDTFKIGDTISVESVFSNSVFDKTTNESYKLRNFRFLPVTYVRRMDKQKIEENLSEYFEVIVDSIYDYKFFYYSDGGSSLVGEYRNGAESYSLKFKLIPKATGLYFFSTGSDINAGTVSTEQDFEKKCRNKSIDAYFNLKNSTDGNVDFLLNSPDPEAKILWDRADEKFHQFAGYCFYVVE